MKTFQVFYLALALAAQAYPQDQTAPAPPSDLRYFADSLYDQRDYDRAQAEYQRALSAGLQNDSVSFNIGLCRMRTGRYPVAPAWFESLAARTPDDSLRARCRDQITFSLYRLARYDACLARLDRLFKSHFRYRALSALCLLEKGLAGPFRNMILHEQTKPLAPGEMRICRELVVAADSVAALRHKSPGLAAGLSLVPGLGATYAGRWTDGIIPFLAITTAYAGVWWYVAQNEPYQAALPAGFGVALHTRTICSSMARARNYYQKGYTAVVDRMQALVKNEHWFLQLGWEPGRL
jgi:tetratricopeptide (TPR) repeat protein